MTKDEKITRNMEQLTTALMVVEGFLLFFSHIYAEKGNVISIGLRPALFIVPISLVVMSIVFAIRDNERRKGDFFVICFAIIIYIALRVASGIENDLVENENFQLSICYEVFFLLGMNKYTVNSRNVKIIFLELISFTLIAISICTYSYLYLGDIVAASVSTRTAEYQSYLPFTYLFSHPNSAGLLSGITASTCMIVFTKSKKNRRILLIPAIAICVGFMMWSTCRTAMVGTTIMIVGLFIANKWQINFNYKKILAITLAICIGFIVPVYIQAGQVGLYDELHNSETESVLNGISSGRYNIWKEHMISQRGHFMLGFGIAENAIKARTDYLKTKGVNNPDDIKDSYHTLGYDSTLGAHNGYLELILVSGIPAAIIIFLILFYKIHKLDNSFINKNSLIMLLIMLFWICVQETRFITSSVRYIAFLMMILLNWRENE